MSLYYTTTVHINQSLSLYYTTTVHIYQSLSLYYTTTVHINQSCPCIIPLLYISTNRVLVLYHYCTYQPIVSLLYHYCTYQPIMSMHYTTYLYINQSLSMHYTIYLYINQSLCINFQVSTDDSDSYLSDSDESRPTTPSHSISSAPYSRDEHSWKKTGMVVVQA